MPDYRVSQAARRDIQAIGHHTQRELGTARRRAYLSGLEQRFRILTSSPFLAAERVEFTPAVRIFPYEKHLIVYRIEPPGIFILRVLHQSMDLRDRLHDGTT